MRRWGRTSAPCRRTAPHESLRRNRGRGLRNWSRRFAPPPSRAALWPRRHCSGPGAGFCTTGRRCPASSGASPSTSEGRSREHPRTTVSQAAIQSTARPSGPKRRHGRSSSPELPANAGPGRGWRHALPSPSDAPSPSRSSLSFLESWPRTDDSQPVGATVGSTRTHSVAPDHQIVVAAEALTRIKDRTTAGQICGMIPRRARQVKNRTLLQPPSSGARRRGRRARRRARGRARRRSRNRPTAAAQFPHSSTRGGDSGRTATTAAAKKKRITTIPPALSNHSQNVSTEAHWRAIFRKEDLVDRVRIPYALPTPANRRVGISAEFIDREAVRFCEHTNTGEKVEGGIDETRQELLVDRAGQARVAGPA